MALSRIYESAVMELTSEGVGSIQLEWNDVINTKIPADTICPENGDYRLFADYWPSQTRADGYRYSVRYDHVLKQLEYLPFFFKTKDSEQRDIVLTTFPFTGNLSTVASIVCDVLNRLASPDVKLSILDSGWTWYVAGTPSVGYTSVNFDGATIRSALEAIADAFDVDYCVDYYAKKITFGQFSASPVYPVPSASLSPKGVTEAPVALVSASNGDVRYNTFRVLGGTRNMGSKTVSRMYSRVTERLTLPSDGHITIDGTDYPVLDGSIIRVGTSEIPIVKDMVFDDVYPKLELYVYDLRERLCWLLDDGGSKIVDYYYYNNPSLPVAVDHYDENGVAYDADGHVLTPVYKEYSKWYFKLAYWDGSVMQPYHPSRDLIIEDMPLKVLFQMNLEEGAADQPLVGREYEVVYYDRANPPSEYSSTGDVNTLEYERDHRQQPEQWDFRIVFEVDGGQIMPSTSAVRLCPYSNEVNGLPTKLSNKVTLLNVALDGVYESGAKADLLAEAQKAIQQESSDKTSFTYSTYGEAPMIGATVNGGLVTQVRKDLITGAVEYTVGSRKSRKGLIGRMSDKIETASATGGVGTTNPADGGSVISGGSSGLSENNLHIMSEITGVGNLRDGVAGLRLSYDNLEAFATRLLEDGSLGESKLVLTSSSGTISTSFTYTDQTDPDPESREHVVTASIGISVDPDTFEGKIVLDADSAVIDAESIDFTAKTIDMSGSTGINLSTDGALNLNASTVNLNAEKITWLDRDVISVGGTSKFSVSANGDVTLRNLTAVNGDFSGTVHASMLYRSYLKLEIMADMPGLIGNNYVFDDSLPDILFLCTRISGGVYVKIPGASYNQGRLLEIIGMYDWTGFGSVTVHSIDGNMCNAIGGGSDLGLVFNETQSSYNGLGRCRLISAEDGGAWKWHVLDTLNVRIASNY